MKYKAFDNDKDGSPTLLFSAVGSSVTYGSGASDPSKNWVNEVASKLNDITDDDISLVKTNNLAVPGYSTSDILENKINEQIADTKADLFIIETSVINDHGQSIALETTRANLKEIKESIEKENGNAKVLFVSPNPVPSKHESLNKLGLSYQDYLDATKEYIESNNWLYFDSSEQILSYSENENIDMEDLLSDDGVHPNDAGYEVWSEVLYEYLIDLK